MYDSMSNHIAEDGFAKLKKWQGNPRSASNGKLKIDQTFMDDLQSFDVNNHEYFDVADDILIIHGTKDEMIPIALSRQFAENNVIEFYPVEDANHPFQNPNHMALAIHKIIEFFRPED